MKSAKTTSVRTLLLLTLMAVCALLLCGAQSQAAQPVRQQKLLFEAPGQNAIIMSAKQLYKPQELDLNVKYSAKASGFFVLKPNTPLGSGFETTAVCGQNGVDLLAGLSQQQLLGDGYMNGIDDQGNLKDSYYVQMSAFDLDKDGVREVLVFVGNRLSELRAYIFRFTGGQEPFKFVGAIDGQSQMSFDKGSIISPVGTQGIFDEYKYSKGKLTQIKN